MKIEADRSGTLPYNVGFMADGDDTTTKTASSDDAPSTADVKTPDGERREMIVVEKRRGFLGRWLRRLVALGIFLLVLVLVGWIGLALLLRSTIPGKLASGIATGALRLDVALGDLDVGLGGDVTITDLAVRLPSKDGQDKGPLVLEVPRIEATLGPLPLVAFTALTGGSPLPDTVTITDPSVYMVEYAPGRWTLPEAAALLAAGGGSSDPEAPPGPIALPDLPDVTLTGGRIVVRNIDGEERIAGDMTLQTQKKSALVYDGGFELPGYANAQFELIPANGRKQTATVKIGGIEELLEPFQSVPSIQIDAEWEGGFTSDGGVAGVLSFDDTTSLTGFGLSGTVDITAAGETATLKPRGLRISGVPLAEEPVEVLAGTLNVNSEAAWVDDLQLAAYGGDLKVAGASFSLLDQTASFAVDFRDLGLPSSLVTGRLDGDLWYGPFGDVRAELRVAFGGEVAGNEVQEASMAAEVYGSGFHNFSTMDVVFTLPESRLVQGGAGETTPLPPLEGEVRVRLEDKNPFVELTRLDAIRPVEGQGTFHIEGRYYLPQEATDEREARPANYGAYVRADGWQVALPRMEEPLPLDVGVVAEGSIGAEKASPIQITELFGRYGDIRLQGSGWYLTDAIEELNGQPPLSLELSLRRRDPLLVVPPFNLADTQDGLPAPTGAGTPDDPTADVSTEPPLLAGTIDSYLSVWGQVADGVNLQSVGTLETVGFVIGPYQLGNVQSKLTASVADEVLRFETDGAQLLDATVALDGVVPFDPEQPGDVTLEVEGLQLARLSELAAIEVNGGVIEGKVDVDFRATLGGFDPKNIVANGTISVADLETNIARVADELILSPRFEAGRLTVPILMRRSGVGLDDPALSPRARVVDGQLVPPDDAEPNELELVVEYDLADGGRLLVRDLAADDYPFVLSPDVLGGERAGAAQVSLASESLMVQFGDGGGDPEGGIETPVTVTGKLAADLNVLIGPTQFDLRDFVNLRLAISADKGAVELDTLEGEIVDVGSIAGGGTLQLADLPGQSDLWIHADVQLDTLAERLKLPEGGTGRLDVAVNVRPAPGEQPKGEVLVDVSFQGTDARFRSVDINRGQLIAYLSRADRPDGGAPQGQYDFTIVTTERIRIFAAGGVIEGYAKVRDRGGLALNANPETGEVDAAEAQDADEGGGDMLSNWFVQATLDMRQLDVAQLGPLADQEDVAGRLDLPVIIYGPLKPANNGYARIGENRVQSPVGFNGEGSVTITRGRLARFNVIARILEVVSFIPTPQRDSLQLDFRLDNGNLFVQGLDVRVDGLKIVGNANVQSFFAGDDAPLSGKVVAVVQPLGGTKIPILKELNDILENLQPTGVRLGGTVGDPSATPTALDEVGDVLGALFGGGGGSE